jgi:hypothetical protein
MKYEGLIKMKKNYKNIILTLLIVFTTNILSQNTRDIRGFVIDEFSQQPLIGVNIEILNTQMGATTNTEGEFTITKIPDGVYNLKFSYIGYQDKFISDIVVKSSRPAILEVKLKEAAIETEAITVIGGFFEAENATQPSVLSLNREEIRRFPGGFEDVVRTVSTLPGIAINTEAGRNDLLVRGGGPSENLYVVNNIEVPNINHFGTQGSSSGSLSFINLDFVEDVTFSTGGFGAQYGDKMSSVLSLNTSFGRTDRIGGKALVSATQFGLNIEGPVSDFGNFIFSARESYLDLIFKAAGLPFVPVYTDFNLIFNGKLANNDHIHVLILGALDRIDRDYSSEENKVTNAGILENNQNQWIIGLNYQKTVGKGVFDITLNSNLYDFKFKQFDDNRVEYFSSDSKENEFGVKLQYRFPVSKTSSFNTGLSSKLISNNNKTVFADSIYNRNGNKINRIDLSLPGRIDNQPQAQKSAAFIEWDWLATSRLDINSGLRLDHFGFIDESITIAPRLSMKFNLTSDQAVKVSTGLYYQSPSYVWLNNSYNKKLKALKNHMSILSWEYFLLRDTRLSVETFYKNYSNLPTGTVPGVNDHIVITNTGTGYGGREDDFQSFGLFNLDSKASGKSYGAEILLEKKFSEIPFYGKLSLTLGKSEFNAGNDKNYPGQYDQRFILNLSGGYILSEKWQFNGKFRYFTGIPFTPVYIPSQNPLNPGNIQNIPKEYLKSRLAAGHHLDLRVDRFFNFENWTLIVYADVQNVYNYQIPLRPNYDFWKNKIDDESSIGLLPSIGVSAEF